MELHTPSLLWVDPVVLSWNTYLDGSSAGDREDHRRAYEHWQHAADILEQRQSALDRIDVITTHKRAIDHRLRLLKDEYQLRSIPLPHAPKGDFQRLEYLGIARHAMVLKLIDIRNRVEHVDADPPEVAACKELVEFTWYFLRSTDMLAVRTPTHFDLECFDDVPDGHGAALSIATGPHSDWVTTMDAVLPEDLICSTYRTDWLEVRLDFFRPIAMCSVSDVRPWRLAVQHIEEGPVDYHVIKGTLQGPASQLVAIYRLYFEPMF